MKPGRVVKIRVNPRDCLSCIDVAGKWLPQGASFAQVVSLALSIVLEQLRRSGAIPDRDGFEYSEMMAPYQDQPHLRRRKLAITSAIQELGSELRPPPLDPQPIEPRLTNRQKVRLEELKFKLQADPENVSQEELEEFRRLSLGEVEK